MNAKVIVVLMTCWFGTAGMAGAQTLDQEMTGLADKIGKALVAKGIKNAAALDFTDIQGQPTELGRFLAEQLTVEIVAASSVSMVDRANLKSILAEHKLTEEGLVNPANAKKLGEFAGVDAILTGNVTALDDGIVLIVKAISTESAQIAAAGRIKFPKTSEIQQLFNRSVSGSVGSSSSAAVSASAGGDTNYQDATAIATKDIGSLRVVFKSVLPMKLKDQNGRSVNGIRCSFEFINRDTQRPLVVAMNAAAKNSWQYSAPNSLLLRSSLNGEHGGMWNLSTSSVKGIGIVGVGARSMSQDYNPTEIGTLLLKRENAHTDSENGTIFVYGSTSSVSPGQISRVTMDFIQQTADTVSAAARTADAFFQIESEILVGVAAADSKVSYSLQNLTFDRVSMPAF